MARDAEAQAAIDAAAEQQGIKNDDVKIDWDDPASVAKARGDQAQADEKIDDKPAAKADDKPAAKADDKPAAKADDKPAAKADDKDKVHTIPKSRFDEINERRKAAESKLARFEAAEQLRKEQAEREASEREDKEHADAIAARETKLDELNDQLVDQLAENKLTEAKQTRRQISKLEREIAREDAEAASQQMGAETVEQIQLQGVIKQLEKDYPEYDPAKDNEKYNDDLVKATEALSTGYQIGGMSPSEAMLKAAKVIMGTRSKGKPGSDNANAVAIQRGLKAAEQQGADFDNVGHDSDTAGVKADLPDPTKLTWEEFEALPESKKQKMRGDFA